MGRNDDYKPERGRGGSGGSAAQLTAHPPSVAPLFVVVVFPPAVREAPIKPERNRLIDPRAVKVLSFSLEQLLLCFEPVCLRTLWVLE